jgi:hypothetical protein
MEAVEARNKRQPGYTAAVLSLGRLEGGIIELSPEGWQELRGRFMVPASKDCPDCVRRAKWQAERLANRALTAA